MFIGEVKAIELIWAPTPKGSPADAVSLRYWRLRGPSCLLEMEEGFHREE